MFKNTATVLVSEILHAPGSKALKSALVWLCASDRTSHGLLIMQIVAVG